MKKTKISKPCYYIIFFDDKETSIRITNQKHPNIVKALAEQYGCLVECKFAKTSRKDEVIAIAQGKLKAEWYELYRDDEFEWKKGKAISPFKS
jgi:hypothetical protein